MRRLIWIGAALIALATAGAAGAGCFATVGVSPQPDVAAGETWTADIRVLQHGERPMTDATPAIVISNAASGEEHVFPATLTDPAEGVYRAAVVFPAAGTWTVAVNDGFPEPQCAQLHTFGTETIAAGAPPAEPPASAEAAPAAAAARSASSGGSVALPLGLGLGLGVGLLAAGGALAARYRRARAV